MIQFPLLRWSKWLLLLCTLNMFIVAQSQAEQDDKPLTILFLGDSLTEGYGVAASQSYPALVEQALLRDGFQVKVVNGGEVGSTSAGGVSRLKWYLRGNPDIVVVALGANDGLRGLDTVAMKHNLQSIIEKSQSKGSKVLLVGMQIPPNYGAEFTRRFADVFPQLAEEMSVPLLPFLLEGVGGVPSLMQADGLHPNARGQAIIAKLMEDSLRTFFSAELDRVSKR